MWHDTETGDQDNKRLEQILAKYLGKFNLKNWAKRVGIKYIRNKVPACLHSLRDMFNLSSQTQTGSQTTPQ